MLTTKFPTPVKLLTLFAQTSTDPVEDMVDMKTFSHHTLTVETALNTTSQVGPTALPRNQSAQSATKLATGHQNATAVNHHQRQVIRKGAIMEHGMEPLDNTQDLARRPIPSTTM